MRSGTGLSGTYHEAFFATLPKVSPFARIFVDLLCLYPLRYLKRTSLIVIGKLDLSIILESESV